MIGNIDHIHIFVEDLEKTVKYFTEILGFRIIRKTRHMRNSYELKAPNGKEIIEIGQADENYPPSITIITGDTQCKMNTFNNYTFYATDPDNDDIYYLIHWGDGIVYYWMGPYKSGEKITISYCHHLMPNQKSDELMISARAKDIHNACGEWGHLYVAISKYDQIIFNRIKFRFTGSSTTDPISLEGFALLEHSLIGIVEDDKV